MRNNKIRHSSDERRVAVLIDCENVSAKNIEFIMKESLKYGLLTIKRIYGDWTDTMLSSWKAFLPIFAIQPIQQFKNTAGKNSTDSSMIIDAMDILYSDNVECFIIVSSDSDFTRLAIRLRESGKFVVGIGEEKTPKSLVNSCNEFNYIEIIEERSNEIKRKVGGIQHKKKISAKNGSEIKKDEKDDYAEDKCLSILCEAYNMVDPDSEWKNSSKIGNAIRKLDPGFDPQTFGFSKLSLLFKKYDDVFNVKLGEDNRTHYVKLKDPE